MKKLNIKDIKKVAPMLGLGIGSLGHNVYVIHASVNANVEPLLVGYFHTSEDGTILSIGTQYDNDSIVWEDKRVFDGSNQSTDISGSLFFPMLVKAFEQKTNHWHNGKLIKEKD